MQLLSVVAAKSTWLFELADLNPQGKSLFPELIEWLKDNYHFESVPKSFEDRDETQGLAFKFGSFQVREEIFIDVHLTVYNDGLLAVTNSSTTDSDALLLDVLTTVRRDFNLAFNPRMIRTRLYFSELVISLENSLSTLDPRLVGLAERITAALGQRNVSPFELGGLSFWTDVTASSLKLAPFVLERRVNAPFAENRFFSRAPLQTSDHLTLLQDLDNLLRPS